MFHVLPSRFRWLYVLFLFQDSFLMPAASDFLASLYSRTEENKYGSPGFSSSFFSLAVRFVSRHDYSTWDKELI